MTTMAECAIRPEHAAVEAMAHMVGVPDDCTQMVKCIDCGENKMAAHCSWHIDRNTFESDGPHCGCARKPV